MLFLRKVSKESGQSSNMELGDCYTLTRKESSYNSFMEIMGDHFEYFNEDQESRCYAFVTTSGGQFIPIFHDSHNFIVTERGSTYEKIN